MEQVTSVADFICSGSDDWMLQSRYLADDKQKRAAKSPIVEPRNTPIMSGSIVPP